MNKVYKYGIIEIKDGADGLVWQLDLFRRYTAVAKEENAYGRFDAAALNVRAKELGLVAGSRSALRLKHTKRTCRHKWEQDGKTVYCAAKAALGSLNCAAHADKERGYRRDRRLNSLVCVQLSPKNARRAVAGLTVEECKAGESHLALLSGGVFALRIPGAGGYESFTVRGVCRVHRPLPPDARVTFAKIVCRPRPHHIQLELHLTLTLPDPTPVQITEGSPVVALDLGYRTTDEGMRVGYFQDGAGTHGGAWLSRADFSYAKYVDGLASTAALHRNAEEHDTTPRVVVGNGRQYTTRTSQMRHIELWRDCQRRKSIIRRDEIYRCHAKFLACKFDVLILEGSAAKPVDVTQWRVQMSKRQTVAPGTFRDLHVAAFESRGKSVVYVPTEYSSRTCHACRRAACSLQGREHTCEHCGATWDRDFNATTNMLRYYREHRDRLLNEATARKQNKEEKAALSKSRRLAGKLKKEEERRRSQDVPQAAE